MGQVLSYNRNKESQLVNWAGACLWFPWGSVSKRGLQSGLRYWQQALQLWACFQTSRSLFPDWTEEENTFSGCRWKLNETIHRKSWGGNSLCASHEYPGCHFGHLPSRTASTPILALKGTTTKNGQLGLKCVYEEGSRTHFTQFNMQHLSWGRAAASSCVF